MSKKDIPENKLPFKCMYPPCNRQVLIDKDKAPVQGIPYTGGPIMCNDHSEMLGFCVWFATAVKMQPQQTASGIVLPGNKEYQAVMPKDEMWKQRRAV